MKKLYCLLLLIWVASHAWGQSADPVWTLLKDEGGVRLSYQLGTCNGQDWLFMLAENTTANRKRLEFQLEVLDQGDHAMRKLPITSLVLMSGEVQQLTCTVTMPHLRFISIPVKNKELFEIGLASSKTVTEN